MIAQQRKTEFLRGFSSMKQLPLIRAAIAALALLVARPTAAAGEVYSPGVESMIVGRGALVLGEGRQRALTIAAGPMFIAGGAYGPVAFAHTEVGYELRIELLTFVLAVGPDLTLTNSRPQSTSGCGSGGIFGPAEPACVRPFTQGDLFAHFRIGTGLTF
jgi:hypothetical protein